MFIETEEKKADLQSELTKHWTLASHVCNTTVTVYGKTMPVRFELRRDRQPDILGFYSYFYRNTSSNYGKINSFGSKNNLEAYRQFVKRVAILTEREFIDA
jgi:hypothetical protein